MNSLTPFIRHELAHCPGETGAPQTCSSLLSPPLGKPPLQPPAPPDNPGTQLPPPEFPAPDQAPPPSAVPITDGTPAGCFQKNASDFLNGSVPGVMAHYGEGSFSTAQHTGAAQPAPDKDNTGVLELVNWREDAPYG